MHKIGGLTDMAMYKSLILGLGAFVLVFSALPGCGGSAASLADEAARLRHLNPAARLGGTTIVGTSDGQHLVGTHGTNFIVALGANEAILGGPGNDQLGSLGANATIVGGAGPDLIFGGPHATLVGGPGRDVIVDTYDGATIRVTGSHSKVKVSGADDKVSCEPSSQDDLIYANPSALIDSSCQANHAQVLLHGDGAKPFAATARVQGTGTNDDPYVAPCDNPAGQDCTVSSFPARSLTGFWANEYVPAYRCPSDHPYLRVILSPDVGVPDGVETRPKEPRPIGVAITGVSSVASQGPQPLVEPRLTTGTLTGFPHSSATNWSTSTNTYQVVLNCTSSTATAAVLVTGNG
ncbi:hypothetical protein [Candidatus Dormiibacter inghamiae]|uniref:calcium-binding protein n=1 Tax=Candidatus Dormiibacter inghamiae TaxID=3127013 RepID=UPI0030C70E93